VKLEDQVCSLELAKRLEELGVKQESLYSFWVFHNDSIELEERHRRPVLAAYKRQRHYKKAYWGKLCSAFTVAELGEMLPRGFNSGRQFGKDLFECFPVFSAEMQDEAYEDNVKRFTKIPLDLEEKEADARAKMLIYLLENSLVKVK